MNEIKDEIYIIAVTIDCLLSKLKYGSEEYKLLKKIDDRLYKISLE